MEPFFKLFKILIIRAFIPLLSVVCSFVLVFPPCTVRSTDAPGYGPEYNYIIQIRKNYHLNSWDNGTSLTIIGSISYWAHISSYLRGHFFSRCQRNTNFNEFQLSDRDDFGTFQHTLHGHFARILSRVCDIVEKIKKLWFTQIKLILRYQGSWVQRLCRNDEKVAAVEQNYYDEYDSPRL